MAKRIRSLELDNGVVVNFLDKGMIEFEKEIAITPEEKQEFGNVVRRISIHDSDLKVIRDTASRNGKIEGGNGVEIVNEKKEKV